MINDTEIIAEVIHAVAIGMALLHFLAGLLLFKDMLRINGAVKTKNSGFFMILSIFYLLFLLGVLVIFLFA